MRVHQLIIVAISTLMVFAPTAEADQFAAVAVLSGLAKVKDGDGVLFGDLEVRLQGVAAPEENSRKVDPGGPESSANLRQVAEGRFVICHLDGELAGRGRPSGICFVDGLELGEHQVSTGHARDCKAFSGGRYEAAELSARKNGNDLSLIYPLPDYC